MMRWLRLPIRSFGLRGGAHGAGHGDLDAWLDTIHRLAKGRAADRERLAPQGVEARARLTRPK